jgi:hypothetical protein
MDRRTFDQSRLVYLFNIEEAHSEASSSSPHQSDRDADIG